MTKKKWIRVKIPSLLPTLLFSEKQIDFAAFLQIAAIESQAGDPLVEVIRALKGLFIYFSNM